MNLNESIVEEAALAWFGELGYAVGRGPRLAPIEYAGGTLTRPLPAASSAALQFPRGEEQSRMARTLIPAFSQREKVKLEAIRRLNRAATARFPRWKSSRS